MNVPKSNFINFIHFSSKNNILRETDFNTLLYYSILSQLFYKIKFSYRYFLVLNTVNKNFLILHIKLIIHTRDSRAKGTTGQEEPPHFF